MGLCKKTLMVVLMLWRKKNGRICGSDQSLPNFVLVPFNLTCFFVFVLVTAFLEQARIGTTLENRPTRVHHVKEMGS